jgi:predicted Rossmann-fold nucleotide-binding protein
LLHGPAYWREVLNLDARVRYGMIAPEDLRLFEFVDDPRTALERLVARLAPLPEEGAPSFARSRAVDQDA